VNCLVTDGNLLFSGSQDSTIRMWDVLPPWFKGQGAASRPLSGLDASCRAPGSTGVHAPSSTVFAVFHAHSAVTGLAFAADSGVLVSCGADGQVLQWDYSTGQLLRRYSLEGHRLSCVAVEPSGLQVFVGTAQGQLLTVPGMDQMCGGEAAAAAAAQKLQAVLSL
jgi:WD40 repeat protein